MVKRSIIVLAVTGLAILGLLAACGGGEAEPTRQPSGPTSAPPTAPPKVASPVASPAMARIATPAASPARPVASPAASPAAGVASPAASPVASGDVERGRTAAAICLACHTTDGRPSVGPTWKGLYGSTVTLADGSTVVADAAYLRESMLDPNAKVVEGFPPVMTSFQGLLTEQQIQDLIAYIESLK